MKFISKFFTVLLSIALVFCLTVSAGAANIENASTSAQTEASLLAADFEISGTTLEADVALPRSYSSKNLGYTTPVRNQLYNTCWAYGSSATLETALLKDGYKVEHFAPMHMNHWGTLRNDGTGWNRDYTGGGYSYISLGYFTSWQGPRLEKDYAETTPFSNFSALDATAPKQVAVNSVIYLDTGDKESVKTAIYKYGAVVGNYHVDEANFDFDNNAYYCNTQGLATSQLNGHCISIVGWNDDFSKNNFMPGARPQNNGAWLCKNSWGSYWGDNGYYWISYEDEYLFDTRFGHSYAFTDYELYDKNKTIYQNEVDGATYEFEYITNWDTITYINVFDTDTTANKIERVNFESISEGALYTIYKIPVDSSTGKPSKTRSKWTEIGSGTIEHQGYTTVDTDDFSVTDEKFAIGVSITKQNGSKNSIGVGEWLTTGNKYIFKPQSKYGQSYIHYSTYSLTDVMDFYKDYLSDDIGGTFVIKAIGTKSNFIGDANLDGRLTITDATSIQRYLALLDDFNDEQKLNADFDNDGLVSVFDATLIQIKLVNTYTDFEDFE